MAKQALAQAAVQAKETTFRKVGAPESNIRFVRPKELADNNRLGLIVQGLYQGTVPNAFDNSKMDYKILGEDGVLCVINSAGNLPFRMQTVAEGTLVRISYTGKSKITKGKFAGKESHNFDVEVAD